MISLLGETINKIKEGFRAFSVNRYAHNIASHYNSLSRSRVERDEYIQKYENFWFTFDTLLGIIDELVLFVAKVEELKPILQQPADIGHIEQLHTLHSYWRLIYNDIYTLVSLLQSAKIISLEWHTNYKELRYIYLLRNDFIQHPEFNYPFENFGMFFGWKRDDKFLPFVMFGPRSGGSPFYFEHFQNKVVDDPKTKNWQNMLKENKEIFIKKGGWKALNQIYKAQLKGWGLPEVDQEYFSQELLNLFEQYIFPHLSKSIETAKREKIIFEYRQYKEKNPKI